MTLGLSTATFTSLHVVLSLIGIASGIIVVLGMLGAKRLDGWTALFLATTMLTSVTGFLFPHDRLLPSHYVAIVTLVAVAVATLARYACRLQGAWRWIFVVSAAAGLYFNSFVAVVQAFQKLSFLERLAPTQSEAPFLFAQSAVAALLSVLAILAIVRFRPAAADGAAQA